MAEGKLNEHKILLAVICENEYEFNYQAEFFANCKFVAPSFEDFSVEVGIIPKNQTFAKVLNNLQRDNDAKYKIFITGPILAFDNSVLSNFINNFFLYPNLGIIGLFGSEMPITGNYTNAQNFYGSYLFRDEIGNIQAHKGQMPLMYQNVNVIDYGIFATSQDIPFDENFDDDLFMAAQCCRYRREGYEVGVIYMNDGSLIFAKDKCMYSRRVNQEFFLYQLNYFVQEYKEIILPLVSICIPTYNQPRFFEMALQSALNQTYPNIEIIVGDDSTNEDTKNMIQPYLKEHKNIKYFYHGGPLGKNGGNNINFVLNKSAGKYINLLFHDDYIFPEKISRMMQYFSMDLEKKINLIVSARVLIDDKNQVLGQMNPCQPSQDITLNGKETGRKILFSKVNFLGELSTSLLKRENLLTRDPKTGKIILSIGNFGGVNDTAYGDIGTWLNLLKNGGECVFIKDTLSAFRQHPAQNTYNLSMRMQLFLDFMNYITIAWLNNCYFHDYNEYKFCCKNWKYFYDMFAPKNIDYETAQNIKDTKKILEKLNKLVIEEKYPEVLDCSIKFLLSVLDENNAITPLIKKNKKSGLYEKANDIIPLRGEQR